MLTERVHRLRTDIPRQTVVPLALAIAVRGKPVHRVGPKVTLEEAVQGRVEPVVVVVGRPQQAVRKNVVLGPDVLRFEDNLPRLQEVEQLT